MIKQLVCPGQVISDSGILNVESDTPSLRLCYTLWHNCPGPVCTRGQGNTPEWILGGGTQWGHLRGCPLQLLLCLTLNLKTKWFGMEQTYYKGRREYKGMSFYHPYLYFSISNIYTSLQPNGHSKPELFSFLINIPIPFNLLDIQSVRTREESSRRQGRI